MLAIQLPSDVEKRLETLAKRSGKTKQHYAEQAVLQYIEDLEDAQLAEERLTKAGKCWTQEEMEQGLDLDG